MMKSARFGFSAKSLTFIEAISVVFVPLPNCLSNLSAEVAITPLQNRQYFS
jgi:hypothetical protein